MVQYETVQSRMTKLDMMSAAGTVTLIKEARSTHVKMLALVKVAFLLTPA